MTRDYWHRIWIIQEITLGKQPTVLCGGKHASLDAFDAVLSAAALCISVRYAKHADSAELFANFSPALPGTFYECVSLETRRRQRHEDGQTMLRGVLVQRDASSGRPFYSATDARDIVFGLLGVVSDAKALGLRADYTVKAARVFADLTKAILNLDDCVPRELDDPTDLHLVSWVPDWRQIGQSGLLVLPIS